MDIRTAEDKKAVLEALLNDTRIEANELRVKLERYRRIIASTRLVMGHEIKRPTTAISGYLEVAREDVEKAGLAEALCFIDKAREECVLLNELNEFYLELLKVDGASGVPGVEKLEIASVVEEAIEHLPATLNAERRVDLSNVKARTVYLCRNAFKLIVLNLLENGLNYSDESAVVRLEMDVDRDQRGTVERDLLKIRVIDAGPGLSPEDAKRAFEPFVRLDDGKAPGAGLGLPLVRSLVDMCDGDVSLRSERGQGTTVFVTLPLASETGATRK